MGLTEKFYLTHDNKFSMILEEDGVALDFVGGGTTRVVVNLGEEYEVDSSDPAFGQGCIDWMTNGDNGELFFSFGQLDITPKEYQAWIVVYDPLHPNGQVIYEFTLDTFNKKVT